MGVRAWEHHTEGDVSGGGGGGATRACAGGAENSARALCPVNSGYRSRWPNSRVGCVARGRARRHNCTTSLINPNEGGVAGGRGDHVTNKEALLAWNAYPRKAPKIFLGELDEGRSVEWLEKCSNYFVELGPPPHPVV